MMKLKFESNQLTLLTVTLFILPEVNCEFQIRDFKFDIMGGGSIVCSS